MSMVVREKNLYQQLSPQCCKDIGRERAKPNPCTASFLYLVQGTHPMNQPALGCQLTGKTIVSLPPPAG